MSNIIRNIIVKNYLAKSTVLLVTSLIFSTTSEIGLSSTIESIVSTISFPISLISSILSTISSPISLISSILKDEGKTIVNINLVTDNNILKFRLKNTRKIDRKSLNRLRNQEIQAIIN